MPLNEMEGIVDEEAEKFMKLRDKPFDTWWADDCDGSRIRHLSAQHQKARETETVIAVKVADGDCSEGFDSESCLLKIYLTSLPGIKDIELPPKPRHQGGEKAVGHGHHAP
jgi:hypothetical protein